jgi:hypothetical protein
MIILIFMKNENIIGIENYRMMFQNKFSHNS